MGREAEVSESKNEATFEPVCKGDTGFHELEFIFGLS